ncbi:MAG: hypothetical protein HQK83_10410 [Fibrobacteria bacterium]|nr:hypothetical protein [Fibrobacteria bacterium]
MSENHKLETSLALDLMGHYPKDAAKLLEEHRVEDIVSITADVEKNLAVKVLQLMNRSLAASCLLQWPQEHREELLSAFPPEALSRILLSLGKAERRVLLSGCQEHTKSVLQRLLRYPDGSAGALMDSTILVLNGDTGIAAARKQVKTSTITASKYLFITDRDGRLTGVCSVLELFRESSSSLVNDIARKPVMKIPAHSDSEAIVSHPGWQYYHVLPVVDYEDNILGILKYRKLYEFGLKEKPQSNEDSIGFALSEMYISLMLSLVKLLFSPSYFIKSSVDTKK